MRYPVFLKKGDTIGVTAPSSGITDEASLTALDNAIKRLNHNNFNVLETPNVRTCTLGRSSSTEDRVNQLEGLIRNKDVKAIICASGGDFLIDIISKLNYRLIKANPKWIQGYSDPTSLLFILTTKYDIATIYGNNICPFGMTNIHPMLSNNIEILKGNIVIQESFARYENERIENEYNSADRVYGKKVKWKNLYEEPELKITGRMIGGCIDVLCNIIGTKYDNVGKFIKKYNADGIIWYFDNFDLNNERMLMTMWQFKEAGWFENTKGIVFGRSLNTTSAYHITIQDTLRSAFEGMGIPIILNADIGHKPPQMTIINGAIATVTSKCGKGTIKFELK